MPRPLSPQEAESLGVSTLHEEMDNGEMRFRLRARDGSSYIRTQSAPNSGWQNSHLHRQVHELNVIQQGAMVVVEEHNGALSVRVIRAGEFYLCPLNVPHNSYLAPDTVAHTVKYGTDLPDTDWVPCPHLDKLCRTLDPEALLKETGQGSISDS